MIRGSWPARMPGTIKNAMISTLNPMLTSARKPTQPPTRTVATPKTRARVSKAGQRMKSLTV